MLVGRVAVLLVVVAVTITAFSLGRRHGDGTSPDAGYVCPMHSQVRSSASGTCPICGMALEPWRPVSSESPPVPTAGGGTAVSEISTSRPRILDYEITIVRPRAIAAEGRAPAWVESPGVVIALLYDDEIATLPAAARVSFAPTASPGAAVAVQRTD